MPDWIPARWREHHGQLLYMRPSRLITPTTDEARQAISEIEVVLAWCSATSNDGKPRCRKDFVFTRHHYPGGWGPASKVQLPAKKADYRRRCKLAPESDIVQASQSRWPYLRVKRIAGV